MPSRLDVLIRALGGTAAVARLFGRHPSTVCRWCAGERPLPAAVAARMRQLAGHLSGEMSSLAYDLLTDVREGEERAARGRAARASASCNRSIQGRLAKLRSLEP
jgi:DNA-binding transcriptional regulator YdaS (Cro superfamily)